jgi:hypothetical protein
VNQPPSTHPVGWMVCGQETLFHFIPPQLTTVITNVLTTNRPHVTHLPNYMVTTYICYLLTYHTYSPGFCELDVAGFRECKMLMRNAGH